MLNKNSPYSLGYPSRGFSILRRPSFRANPFACRSCVLLIISKGAQVSSIHDESYKLLLACIRATRRAENVTQAELGERLGMDQSFVSKYERGERRLDVVELRAICKALGIDLMGFLAEFEAKLKHKGLA